MRASMARMGQQVQYDYTTEITLTSNRNTEKVYLNSIACLVKSKVIQIGSFEKTKS